MALVTIIANDVVGHMVLLIDRAARVVVADLREISRDVGPLIGAYAAGVAGDAGIGHRLSAKQIGTGGS